MNSIRITSCRSFASKLWFATAWRPVATCGTFLQARVAHVAGYPTKDSAEAAVRAMAGLP